MCAGGWVPTSVPDSIKLLSPRLAKQAHSIFSPVERRVGSHLSSDPGYLHPSSSPVLPGEKGLWTPCPVQFSSVQSLICVQLFAIPWTAACQASLSIINFWSSLKLTSTESQCHPAISSSVVPFSSCFQYFPASGSFQMSQFFASGGQHIGASVLASVLPVNIQD